MQSSGRIISIKPDFAIPGGEVEINCEGIRPHHEFGYRCFFNGTQALLTGASPERILAVVPDGLVAVDVDVQIEGAGGATAPAVLRVGKRYAEDLHMVANPAIDPKDGSLIVTRSGSRGQKLPVTLFRVRHEDDLEEIRAEVMNPTGIAFDRLNRFFVTNRADGEVCEVRPTGEVVPHASGLGVATGIAFDADWTMYVGDRGGTVYKVSEFGESEVFATLEPSVAAYHMAFGPGGNLFVTAPGLSSFDAIYTIDQAGNLYVAASYKARRGIVKITEDGESAELLVAGNNVIGLCFGPEGEMFVATNDSVFMLPVGIKGTLLG